MGPEARLSCVYIQRGLKVAMYPSSPCLPRLPPPPPPPLPAPLLCWPAPLRPSRGRFLPQLGVLGCVAACLYWSVDFLVAACTYLNIPRPLLFVPGLVQSLPTSLPSRPPRPSSLSLLLLLLHPPHLLFSSIPINFYLAPFPFLSLPVLPVFHASIFSKANSMYLEMETKHISTSLSSRPIGFVTVFRLPT